ncbi:hypothetical protein YC2023_070010 [Brassica napus]
MRFPRRRRRSSRWSSDEASSSGYGSWSAFWVVVSAVIIFLRSTAVHCERRRVALCGVSTGPDLDARFVSTQEVSEWALLLGACKFRPDLGACRSGEVGGSAWTCRLWLVLLPCSWHILFVSPPVSAIPCCLRSGSSRRITVVSGSPALGCSSSVLLLRPGFKPVFVSGSQSLTMSSSCPIQLVAARQGSGSWIEHIIPAPVVLSVRVAPVVVLFRLAAGLGYASLGVAASF